MNVTNSILLYKLLILDIVHNYSMVCRLRKLLGNIYENVVLYNRADLCSCARMKSGRGSDAQLTPSSLDRLATL